MSPMNWDEDSYVQVTMQKLPERLGFGADRALPMSDVVETPGGAQMTPLRVQAVRRTDDTRHAPVPHMAALDTLH